jgi:rubrerythrin
MTVRTDMERAIAMAEAAKGGYLLFATQSEDETAHQVFSDMAEDMKRHVMILESRRDYLDQHNKLNQAGDENGGGKDKKQKQKQKGGKDDSG